MFFGGMRICVKDRWESTYVKGLPLALIELGGFAGFGETVVFGQQDSCPEHGCPSHVGKRENMATEWRGTPCACSWGEIGIEYISVELSLAPELRDSLTSKSGLCEQRRQIFR
jgi:hypothetical protein